MKIYTFGVWELVDMQKKQLCVHGKKKSVNMLWDVYPNALSVFLYLFIIKVRTIDFEKNYLNH